MAGSYRPVHAAVVAGGRVGGGDVGDVFRISLMPSALLHYCGVDGCSARVREAYCPAHTKARQQDYDDRRGSSAQRGYGAKWRAYRDPFVVRYPLCGMRPPGAPQTADSVCARRGQPTPTQVVDHIQPVTSAQDVRFYDETNHQALCERCHNAKRNREARGVASGVSGSRWGRTEGDSGACDAGRRVPSGTLRPESA
jgi:5-methylcytosine-specific restriction enzyme A